MLRTVFIRAVRSHIISSIQSWTHQGPETGFFTESAVYNRSFRKKPGFSTIVCKSQYGYFSLGNDAMPTNSIANPPPRIPNASKPTAKSNPDVFSIKLNRSPAVRRALRTLHINVKKWFDALLIAVGYLGCTLRIDALLIWPILCQWLRSILGNRGRRCCGISQLLHPVY